MLGGLGVSSAALPGFAKAIQMQKTNSMYLIIRFPNL
jgi:hypothetical protein